MRNDTPTRTERRITRLFAASLMAGGIVVLPVDVALSPFSVDQSVAIAKSDNERGGDHDRGRGQGRGRGGDDASERGHSGTDKAELRRHGRGHKSDDAKHGSSSFLDDLEKALEKGLGRGRKRDDPAFASARGRYDSTGRHGRGDRHDRFEYDIGAVAHELDPDDVEELTRSGWKGSKKGTAADDGFASHGDRVRTMVQIAKELGYGARTGAMQANFGTPYENGIADIETDLEEARAEADKHPDDESAQRVADLEADLDRAMADAKPGNGPDDAWTRADLDVNEDGWVDHLDLEAVYAEETEDEGDEAEAGDEGDETALTIGEDA